MDFGQPTTQAQLDRATFLLPDDYRHNASLLSLRYNKVQPLIRMGGPVWSAPEWVGQVYPPGTSQKDYLRAYSKCYSSVELSPTFYGLPDLKTVQNWKSAVTENKQFQFVPKIWKQISHEKQLSQCHDELALYLRAVIPLQETLGPSLLQLPPTFTFRQFGALKKFLLLFPKELPINVELRHPSWFSNNRLRTEAVDFFIQNDIGTCITDTVGRRDVLHCTLTRSQAMIRFLGNDLHPTDFTRINDWSQKFLSWLELGIQEIYFFAHQPTLLHTPTLLDSAIEQLNSITGLALHRPSLSHQPEQSAQLGFTF